MVIEKEWPEKCAPLMRERRPDEFAVTFAGGIEYLEYVVVLPDGFDTYCDAIGLVKGRDDYSIAIKRTGAAPVEVRLVARGIPSQQRVGMRLDLKEKTGARHR